VGSILEHIPPLWEGYVLGAGKLYEDSRLHLHTNTATILAVRGPLTARQCPQGDYAIGDPGLLAPELIIPPYEPDKLYDLGIVPHWTDDHLAKDPRFQLGEPWVTRIINPRQDPMTVIREISHCRKIVTSSLHGMILADSFGIPRRFEPAAHWGPSEGGMFKFRDYLASIGAPFTVGKTTTVSRLRVEDRKYELIDAYEDLGRMVRHR
jgi:pyruvyltransferase